MNEHKDPLLSATHPGEYIKELRNRQHPFLTLKKLEELTGINKATLQSWEAEPRLNQRRAKHREGVNAIAMILGVSPDEIWAAGNSVATTIPAPRFVELPCGGEVPCNAEDYVGPSIIGDSSRARVVAVPIMPFVEKDLVEVANVAGHDFPTLPDRAQIGLSAEKKPLAGVWFLVEQGGLVFPCVMHFATAGWTVQYGESEPRPFTGAILGRIISVEWADTFGTVHVNMNASGLRG